MGVYSLVKHSSLRMVCLASTALYWFFGNLRWMKAYTQALKGAVLVN